MNLKTCDDLSFGNPAQKKLVIFEMTSYSSLFQIDILIKLKSIHKFQDFKN